MNVVLPIAAKSNVLSVHHSIVGYSRETQRLVSEFEVPGFLDTLAQKIAEVDSDDPDAVFNYFLTPRQTTAFLFILGLNADLNSTEYFLEPSSKSKHYNEKKAEAVSVFTALSARSQTHNRKQQRITESELTVPTLRILNQNNGRWVKTSELQECLTKLFEPSGIDAEILSGRSDTYFSQKVRNIVSHKTQNSSFIKKGLADYSLEQHGLRITERGHDLIEALRD